jgi:hypothetical protein
MKSYKLHSNPYTVKSLDISTGHLTEQDNNLLQADADNNPGPNTPVAAYKYEYGYFVYVGEEAEDQTIKEYGYSDSFINILKKARELKCKYVQYDSDGIQYEDIPFYNW